MEENRFPIAYIFAIVVGLVMVGLTIWRFTLPSPDPLVIMGILFGGGIVECLIICHCIAENSLNPFLDASLPLGAMFIWSAVVILACGLWYAIIDKNTMMIIYIPIVSIMVGFLGVNIIKD